VRVEIKVLRVTKEVKVHHQSEHKDRQGLKEHKDHHLLVRVDQSELKVIKEDKDRRQSELKDRQGLKGLKAQHR
jgi:hypothetical protein